MSGLLSLIALLGLAQTGEPAPEQAAQPASAIPVDYLVGPEDLLEIEVFQLEELNKTVRVGQDGNISFPLIGKVEVSGLTRSQLEERLAELLARRYVRDPQVTVFIKEYRSRRVSVLGAVGEPGSYELIGRKRLLDLLGMAGGVSQEAGDKLLLLREGMPEPIRIELDELLREGRPELNLELKAGDVLNVPQRDTITVYVYGEVNDPGAYKVDRDRTITVLQAVATAGGLGRRASAGKVKVHRPTEEDGRVQVLEVNLDKVMKGELRDLILEDGDTVVVPRSFF